MQTFVFETAWDRTIAPEDRTSIKALFEKTKNNTSERIVFIPISEAYNHREDLLIMVLIHNFRDTPFSFEKLDLIYTENNQQIAAHHFSFPELKLDAKSSMPWTFIFPESAQKQKAVFENGQLFFQTDYK